MRLLFTLALFVAFIQTFSWCHPSLFDFPYEVSHTLYDLLMKFLSFTYSNKLSIDSSYSRKYLNIVSPVSDQIAQAVLVAPRIHMDELCPVSYDHCWCGFQYKPGDHLQRYASRPFLTMRICIQTDNFRTNKEFLVEKYSSLFSLQRDKNGQEFDFHVYREEFQTIKYLSRGIQAKTRAKQIQNNISTVKKLYNHTVLYKHDESVCPQHFKWCWCGFINTMDEYNGKSICSKRFEECTVLIDCRPFKQRPFETRNCSPDLNFTNIDDKTSEAWLKKRFPCGHFKIEE